MLEVGYVESVLQGRLLRGKIAHVGLLAKSSEHETPSTVLPASVVDCTLHDFSHELSQQDKSRIVERLGLYDASKCDSVLKT